jgi:PEGA domain
MSLRPLSHCAAVLFALIFLGNATMRGQAAVEHGVMMGNSAGAAASMKPLIPAPETGLPESSPGAGSGAPSKSASVAGETPESIAKGNLQFFQTHSGLDAAQVAVHTVPDHAEAWIDGRFVGPAPLDLKLAPGHHEVLVRAPNMRDSEQEFDLAAKQTQTVNIPLKATPQTHQVIVLHWPAQK